MPGFVAFGGDVMHVITGFAAEDAFVGSHLNARAAQACDLFGIIGQERYAINAQLAQHLGGEVEAGRPGDRSRPRPRCRRRGLPTRPPVVRRGCR